MLCGCSASPGGGTGCGVGVQNIIPVHDVMNESMEDTTLTSKIILWSPKQKVEPKGLVLLADEDLPVKRTINQVSTHIFSDVYYRRIRSNPAGRTVETDIGVDIVHEETYFSNDSIIAILL